MGLLIAIIMLVAPLWILIDIITRRQNVFDVYQKIDAYLKKPKVAIPLTILVVINWVWNITKGL